MLALRSRKVALGDEGVEAVHAAGSSAARPGLQREAMYNWMRYATVTIGVGLLAAVISTKASPPVLAQDGDRGLECDGQPCGAVVRGSLAFHDRELKGLAGNGRACADCHIPSDGFQLSPVAAKEMYFSVPGRAQAGLPQVSVRVDREENLRDVEQRIKAMGLEK